MNRFNTPLRYPGGKGKLTDYFKDIVTLNDLENGTYIEPYAGGAGIAINLLMGGNVSNIVINDADPAVYSFWKVATENTDELTEMIRNVELSLDEWDNQKRISKDRNSSRIERGFSTLYLNRTNRSGILAAGPIGGRTQSGTYTLGVRFNKNDLINRINEIGNKSDHIEVLCMDGSYFLSEYLANYDIDNTLVYIDPPYYDKGSLLYMNHYKEKDHVELAETIKGLDHKWILSYDNVQSIRDIYSWTVPLEFRMYYSAYSTKLGNELFFKSAYLKIPEESYPVKSTSTLDIEAI
mgnify:CR=1 FL=1